MTKDFFLALENAANDSQQALSTVLAELQFNQAGLIPVIAQDHASREVLMLAWMNRDAIERTLASGDMVYWSRSRQKFWRKGESSGHFQRLLSMRIDCDGDTLLCDVQQTGAACHTGRRSCFYLQVDSEGNKVLIREH